MTEAGRSLLEDARRILALADDARQRLRRNGRRDDAAADGLRQLAARRHRRLLAPTVAVRIDEWVLPSHAQADRVAEGSLDLALAWVDATAPKHAG